MNVKQPFNGIPEAKILPINAQLTTSLPLKYMAVLVSWIFHPIFIPVYIVISLIQINPLLFGSSSAQDKAFIILRFFIMYCFFPLITVLLAKGLGFIKSIYLKTQKDRIIPYIASGIYYFWMCYVLRHQPVFATEIVILSMAIFIAASLGLIANIYFKISMHGISAGIAVAFFVLLAATQPNVTTLHLSIVLLLAGLILTSRLILGAHNSRDVYYGFFLGVISLFAAIFADKILP